MQAKLHHNIDTTIKFLSPLLPLANCHMVEFFTQNHWERLIPNDLRNYLDKFEINDAVDKFWKYAEEGLVGML